MVPKTRAKTLVKFRTILIIIYLYVNINPIGLSPLNEGGPQPVLHIRILDIAYNIAPPIYTLYVVTHISYSLFEDF